MLHRLRTGQRTKLGRSRPPRDSFSVAYKILASILLLMGILSSFRRPPKTPKLDPPVETPSMEVRKERVNRALWCFFAGDALASPSHWFYGGKRQVIQVYGSPITGYTKPVLNLPGSILNKSNLYGGGRQTAIGSSLSPIIGDVINHGKAHLWDAKKSIHYHATLERGEITLEASLGRVLLQSITEKKGFDADHFREAYMKFMQTPNSHNDTYASTCHRMFFANLIYRKLDPEQCPDNDRHNVDTVDGLVLPTISALFVAVSENGTAEEAGSVAASTARVTRRSTQLETYASAWGKMVFAVVHGAPLPDAARTMAKELRLRSPKVKSSNEVTACYLDSAVPAMLDFLVTHKDQSPWDILIENANTGGENVHRGSCMGAVVGASSESIPSQLVSGLYQHEQIRKEIDGFLDLH